MGFWTRVRLPSTPRLIKRLKPAKIEGVRRFNFVKNEPVLATVFCYIKIRNYEPTSCD